jgi:hypothetical protein
MCGPNFSTFSKNLFDLLFFFLGQLDWESDDKLHKGCHPKSHLLPLMISTDEEMKKSSFGESSWGRRWLFLGKIIFEFKIYCLNN